MHPCITAQGLDMCTHPFVRRATRQQTKPPLNIMPLTNNPRTQQGLTLVELMVGIAIGLLVVAVAMGALMVSRGISGTVSDASGIQQQAAYAMRLFGQQLRQAGSMRLNLNPGTTVTEDPHRAAVAFETVAVSASSPAFSYNAGTANQVIAGADSPDSLTVGFRRYTEPVFTSATERSQVRNCLGGPDDNTSTDERMESIFIFNAATNTLSCNGNANGAGAQPVLQNVANFQVRYLLQDVTTTPGVATVRTVDATAVGTNWAQVQAVEVCLVLYGNEAIDMPADGTSTYRDCDAAGTAIDMAALAGTRARRMHITFRNVFQLRSQGLIGSVLNPA